MLVLQLRCCGVEWMDRLKYAARAYPFMTVWQTRKRVVSRSSGVMVCVCECLAKLGGSDDEEMT